MGISVFAIKIDETKFDKKVILGSSTSKKFTLTNNKDKVIRYNLSVEGDKKNISVEPKRLLIGSGESKSFTVKVSGDKQGKASYYLVVDEDIIDLKPEANQMKIKMKYRFKQNYEVE